METKEVKVRLWGSGVGVGTSRYSTAVVPVSFMMARESHATSIKAKNTTAAPSLKKRKHHHVDQPQADDSHNDLPVDATIEDETEVVPDKIEFDSEAGIGIRPEFSMLRLPSQTAHPEVVYWSADSSQNEEGNPTDPTMDAADALETATTMNQFSSTQNALANFWKSIEESNYFLPFSKKSHRLEELYIRGNDYGKLIESIHRHLTCNSTHLT